MSHEHVIPKRYNWIRAIAIIVPILLPASYLIRSLEGVAIAQVVSWVLYALLLNFLPIKRRWLYTMMVILVSTFLLSIAGSLLSVQANLTIQIIPIVISAVLLTIGTLLFSAFAWGIFLVMDGLVIKLIHILWLKPKSS